MDSISRVLERAKCRPDARVVSHLFSCKASLLVCFSSLGPYRASSYEEVVAATRKKGEANTANRDSVLGSREVIDGPGSHPIGKARFSAIRRSN